jgi:hypothetical protein
MISRGNGASRYWDMPPGRKNWYGDYQTASGYFTIAARAGAPPITQYRFYPMWVEPDNTIRYTEVAVDTDPSGPPSIKLNMDSGPDVTLKAAQDRPLKAVRTLLSRVQTGAEEEEAGSEHDEDRERGKSWREIH